MSKGYAITLTPDEVWWLMDGLGMALDDEYMFETSAGEPAARHAADLYRRLAQLVGERAWGDEVVAKAAGGQARLAKERDRLMGQP